MSQRQISPWGEMYLLRAASYLVLFLFSLLSIIATPGAHAQVAAATSSPARILYINSYHRGYAWSDAIENAIRETLAEAHLGTEISVEYLDSYRFNSGAQVEPLVALMAAKYATFRHDLVIVSDNAAFDFAVENRNRLFAGAPIVFCGYNQFRPEMVKGIANITGISEDISVVGTIELALKVHPRTRALVFVTSSSDAGSVRIAQTINESVLPKYRPRFELLELRDASTDEIRQSLTSLPRETVVFVAGQTRDAAASRLGASAENGQRLSAASPFPIYTFWDSYLNMGALGGQVITGQEQGRTAAELALRILGGTPADAIPVVMTSSAISMFDYNLMQRFGISTSALPPDSVIINRPFSMWRAYPWQIVSAIMSAIVGLMLSLALVRYVLARRKVLEEQVEQRAKGERRAVERMVELKNANQRLAQLSFSDGLTQLANRRRFDEVLESEFLRLGRTQLPLSLIMIDIDHFKNFNDTYGHVAGDDCLRLVAGVIASVADRASDLAARYGGEEFAVILADTDAAGVTIVAERIRQGIQDLALPHRTSNVAKVVTASLGVITMTTSQLATVKDVILLADQLLYRAKSGGRNRVMTGTWPPVRIHAPSKVTDAKGESVVRFVTG